MEKQDYKSGVLGCAVVQFGGNVGVDAGVYDEGYLGIRFREIAETHEIGDNIPNYEPKSFDKEVLFVFNDIRSLDVIEHAISRLRERFNEQKS